jgi:hypothetical protein
LERGRENEARARESAAVCAESLTFGLLPVKRPASAMQPIGSVAELGRQWAQSFSRPGPYPPSNAAARLTPREVRGAKAGGSVGRVDELATLPQFSATARQTRM